MNNQCDIAKSLLATKHFQLDVIMYGLETLDIFTVMFNQQAVRNAATVLLKAENRNTLVYHIYTKEKNLDYTRLYDNLIFLEHPRIKHISLKGVLKNGECKLLPVQRLSIPRAFLTAHGKRKSTEPLGMIKSFNSCATPKKKVKLAGTNRGIDADLLDEPNATKEQHELLFLDSIRSVDDIASSSNGCDASFINSSAIEPEEKVIGVSQTGQTDPLDESITTANMNREFLSLIQNIVKSGRKIIMDGVDFQTNQSGMTAKIKQIRID
ncbi:hypothetical protein HDV02_003505 [Globomyces sp. JEL0801]|nr:hypothetical protein HDV02_003505 [Globomyces sp. JEL0801]